MSSTLAVPRNDMAEDSTSSGAEAPARKRLQRSAIENENPLRKQPGSAHLAKTSSDQKSTLASRRRSILTRDNKPALNGPRPLELSPGKRILSGAAPSNNTTRTFLPSSTSEPHFGYASRGDNAQFSFNSKPLDLPKPPPSYNDQTDFLPAPNFDDFHASITSPQLSDFPSPTGGHITLEEAGRSMLATMDNAESRNNVGAKADRQPTLERKSSLIRRLSNARRRPSNITTTSASSTSTATAPPAGAPPLSVRTRRQSHFPAPTPAPNTAAARAPRKSVGPGLLTAALDSKGSRHEMNRLASFSSHESLSKQFAMGDSSRKTIGVSPIGHPDTAAAADRSRATKAKSMMPRERSAPLLSTSHQRMTPVNGLPSSIAGARSPARSPRQKAHTPSSSQSKRQSVVPVHATGLGARTTSPTDKRRRQRLSMVPPPPPTDSHNLHKMPLSPQPSLQSMSNLMVRPVHSPAAPVIKSGTPSSARATPDGSRRTTASALSASSNSSLNTSASTRPPILGSLPRSNQNLLGSRLPTPKPRNLHSSAGLTEEEVPPVPLIPKQYESPKEQQEQFRASQRKLVTPAQIDDSQSDIMFFDDLAKGNEPALDTTMSESTTSTNGTGNDTRHAQGISTSSRHRRGLTVGVGNQRDNPPNLQNVKKKSLQPLRLPPLNLLPLSTPTAARIASLPAPSAEVDQRRTTPPPKRSVAKTPSTPMTASKATFHSRDHDDHSMFSLRSSSSHYQLRPMDHSLEQPSLAIPIPHNSNSRQMTTPFASASLPKQSADFGRMKASHIADSTRASVFDETDELQLGSLEKSQTGTKKDNASVHTTTSEEPETPSSGSSIRRKLSLGWKRSSSKAATHTSNSSNFLRNEHKEKHSSQSSSTIDHKEASKQIGAQSPRRNKLHREHHSKKNDMPPPKLPASATMHNLGRASPANSIQTRQSLDLQRRKSSGGPLLGSGAGDNAPHGLGFMRSSTMQPHSSHGEPAANAPAVRSASSSILPSVHRMLSSKSSLSALRSRSMDEHLDRDDLAAEQYMKRLTAKRKDVEVAGKELDELRKRATPKAKVTPAQALGAANLNIFEKGEIIDYKEIYFCGTKNAKKHVGDLGASSHNFGYDDERGDYNIVMGDHLAYRYEVVDMLGKGSFGQVVRCIDHKSGMLCAVKIIRNKKRFHQQALVEVNILQRLRDWDPENKHSMINFTHSFYFRGHLCISTELLGMNLYEFIKAYEFKGFSLTLIRRFAKQILSSLALLKTKRVIHCDLKPENILLAHPLHSEIKVIDFGSSCFENEKVYTYIQSRFYRSPEVILGMSYGLPIDMWSLGCILAELLTGYPIFPGENEQEQLACIMEIFGPPEKHLIEKSSRKKLFFDSMGKPRVTVSSKGRRRRPNSKTLQQTLKCDDDAFIDFVSRCLRWDPEKRMKPEEAFQHEFLTGVKRSIRVRSEVPSSIGLRSISAATTSSTSPIKRHNTIQTPQRGGPRPLPEPPATSFRNGLISMASKSDLTAPAQSGHNTSPVKMASAPGGRRHSTAIGLQSSGASTAGSIGAGVKRLNSGAPVLANGGNTGSALPRVVGGRSVSGKPDLASAAAVASLRR